MPLKGLLLIVIVAQVACTTATIRKTDGTSIEAKIVRSDNSAIYVLPSNRPEELLKVTTIPRSDIAVIDTLDDLEAWPYRSRIIKKDSMKGDVKTTLLLRP